MEPPVTTSPENRLTPSRWAFESRPFLVEPKPFFDAMTASLRLDTGDHHLGKALAVALGFSVLFFPFELEDEQLFAASMDFNFGVDFGAFGVLAGLQLARVVDDSENFVERNFGAGVTHQLFDLHRRAGDNAILLAASLDNCVHR